MCEVLELANFMHLSCSSYGVKTAPPINGTSGFQIYSQDSPVTPTGINVLISVTDECKLFLFKSVETITQKRG